MDVNQITELVRRAMANSEGNNSSVSVLTTDIRLFLFDTIES